MKGSDHIMSGYHYPNVLRDISGQSMIIIYIFSVGDAMAVLMKWMLVLFAEVCTYVFKNNIILFGYFMRIIHFSCNEAKL